MPKSSPESVNAFCHSRKIDLLTAAGKRIWNFMDT